MTIHRTWHTLININNMKFQLIRVCLIFYTYDSANFKKHRNNHEKNATATALALLCLQDVSTDVYFHQNKPAAVAPKETITHHFFVSELGRRKPSMQPKFVAAQKMPVNRNPANIRKWIARFYYFRHLYSAGSACVLLTIIAWVAHRYGQLAFALLINILLGSFQLFLHMDQPSLRGWK